MIRKPSPARNVVVLCGQIYLRDERSFCGLFGLFGVSLSPRHFVPVVLLLFAFP
jgi:hypothetical protein